MLYTSLAHGQNSIGLVLFALHTEGVRVLATESVRNSKLEAVIFFSLLVFLAASLCLLLFLEELLKKFDLLLAEVGQFLRA